MNTSLTQLWKTASLALLLLVLAALFGSAPSQAVTVEMIPSPRPAGWTADLTGALPPTTLEALNRLGDEVKAQTGAELAVVVVGTIDGAEPRDFATRLFNAWRIGETGRDNGVLVFAALDDRRIEIVLGQGLSSPDQVQVSQQIIQGEMEPRFRTRDAPGAVYQGALACAQRLLRASPTPEAEEAPPVLPAGATFETAGLAVPGSRAQPASFPPPPQVDAGPLLGLGGFTALILTLGTAAALRRRLRTCPHCKAQRIRLDEEADDAHLSAAERAEERIGSASYEVWACPGCGEISKLRHSRFFTGYAQCPECGAKTKSRTSTTVREASYDAEGLVRIEESCEHCPYHSSSLRRKPMLQREDDSQRFENASKPLAGAALFAASAQDGSSPDSSGSGSDSGFGGGHSDGAGASGDW